MNKATGEIREFARRVLTQPEYQDAVETMFRELPPQDIPSHYVTLLHYYAHGKPKEVISHEGGTKLQVSDAAESFRGRILRLVARRDQGEGTRQPFAFAAGAGQDTV